MRGVFKLNIRVTQVRVCVCDDEDTSCASTLLPFRNHQHVAAAAVTCLVLLCAHQAPSWLSCTTPQRTCHHTKPSSQTA
jgi:hypothetical protein